MTCLSSVAVEKAYFSEQPHIFFLPPPPFAATLLLKHMYIRTCYYTNLSTNLLEYFTWTDLPACTISCICTFSKMGRQTRDLVYLCIMCMAGHSCTQHYQSLLMLSLQFAHVTALKYMFDNLWTIEAQTKTYHGRIVKIK